MSIRAAKSSVFFSAPTLYAKYGASVKAEFFFSPPFFKKQQKKNSAVLENGKTVFLEKRWRIFFCLHTCTIVAKGLNSFESVFSAVHQNFKHVRLCEKVASDMGSFGGFSGYSGFPNISYWKVTI